MRDIVRKYLPPEARSDFDQLSHDAFGAYFGMLIDYWNGGEPLRAAQLLNRGIPVNIGRELCYLRLEDKLREEVEAARRGALAEMTAMIQEMGGYD